MNLHALLQEAVDREATDLYLIAGAVPCISIEGQYLAPEASGNKRLSPEALEAFAKSIMQPRHWEEFERTNECNLAYMTPAIGRFRVNVLRQRGSIGMVMRRVVMDIPTMRSLGLLPVLRDISLADRGIVVVTGATGSGKSTTMASMIDYRNHLRSGHIVTIEDPIEFVYTHRRSIVTQREVGMDTASFHEALKNSLRQAPSVISIGEMRDSQTVEFALHAAETGHLVFGTLHSTNAVVTLERILHFFPAGSRDMVALQLALNLRAVVCQRLPRRIDGRRRVCAQEVLVNTPRIQDLVARGEMHEVRATLMAENNVGMQHFDKSLYYLNKRGLISKDEALFNSESPSEMSMKLKGIGVEAGSSWENWQDPWVSIPDDYGPPEDFSMSRVYDPKSTDGYSNEKADPIERPARPKTEIKYPAPPAPAPAGPPTPVVAVPPRGATPPHLAPPPAAQPPAAQPAAPAPPPAARPAAFPKPAPGTVTERYRHMIDNAVQSKADIDEVDPPVVDLESLDSELDH